jgi:hypothetical protein
MAIPVYYDYCLTFVTNLNPRLDKAPMKFLTFSNLLATSAIFRIPLQKMTNCLIINDDINMENKWEHLLLQHIDIL